MSVTCRGQGHTRWGRGRRHQPLFFPWAAAPPAALWLLATCSAMVLRFRGGVPLRQRPAQGGGRETQRASWPFTRARQLPALARLRRPCKGLVPLLWLWTDLIGAVSPREGSAGPSPRGQRPEGRTTPPFASARLLCSAALVGVGALRWPRPVPRAAYLERRQVVVVIDGGRLWVRRRHLGGRGAARARVEAPQATQQQCRQYFCAAGPLEHGARAAQASPPAVVVAGAEPARRMAAAWPRASREAC